MQNKAFIVNAVGNFKALELTEIEIPKLKKREVLVRNLAIGLNFFDIEYRRGTLKFPNMPFIPGMEGVGEIVETGESVTEFKVGQRVGYATALSGAYAHFSVIDSNLLFPIPKEISNEQAASCMTKGMTSHYLLRRTFYVKPDIWILIHAAAGGVGHIMTALAKHYGAKVIATVGSAEKAEFLSGFKPDHIINYNETDFVSAVNEITNGVGVSVVYDSVGEATFIKSLAVLSNFGLIVNFGQSSGRVKDFSLRMLSAKSLFVCCPRIRNYKKDRKELVLSALEVFGLAHSGVIPSLPQKIYKFEEIPLAHDEIETRKTFGSQIVLLS